MKKFYLMLAAVAAFAFNAQADSAQIDLGGYADIEDYSDGDLYNGGAICNAPINFYHASSAAQIIYTPEDLSEAFDGKINAKVTKLSFKLFNEMGFDEYPRDIKVYASLNEATAFGKDGDGDWNFFSIDENDVKASFDIDGYFNYYEVNEFVVDLANSPIALEEGKSLIVTIVADGEDDTDASGDLLFYCDNSRSKRVFAYASDFVTFGDYAESANFPKVNASCDENIDLPVTLIDYTYDVPAITAVSEIHAADSKADAAYYNLMGQKLDGNNLPAGIYIHNGKKFVK